MFNRKVETVGTIAEFMRRDDEVPPAKPARTALKAAATSAIPLAFAARPAFASGGGEVAAVEAVPAGAVGEAVKERIMGAFDPLVELMITLSYPIAGVMLTGGALAIMIGMRDKGYSMIQTAGIGYILVQMTPLFLKLLVGIGGAI
jgi:hypothetical protein